MKTIQLKDFLDFHFLSDLRLSPDGRMAAYLSHQCDEKNDCYQTRLMLLPAAAVAARDKKPVFAWEDDATLLYAYPEEKSTVFIRHDARSGQDMPGFTVPLACRTIEAIGRDQYLITAKTVLNPEDYQEDDCVIVTELPVQENGTGYISGTRTSLFLFDARLGALKQLTPRTYDTDSYAYSAGRRMIALSGQSFDGKKLVRGGLAVYDLKEDAFREILAPGVWRVTFVSFLRDQIVFAGTLGKFNNIMENPHFCLIDGETGAITDFAYPDYYIGGLSVGSDCRYSGGIHCKASGDKVYFTSAKVGDSPLFELSAEGKTREVTGLPGSVDCFDVASGRCLFVGMRDMGLEEIYELDLANGRETCLTKWNAAYVAAHEIVRPDPLFFETEQGATASGWVMKPLGFDEKKTYPAILDIHGGPKGTYGEVYYHEMQVWAQAGYFVFFCNPHGSDGHGDEYSRIMQRNGTLDYDDLMRFTDLTLAKYPQIDADRVGVTGGSYGGFMTNWIVGHTDRFRCAATQRSIGDWIVHEYNCDTGYWVTCENFPPNAIVSAQDAWADSPAKYDIDCKTPLLFIHSDQDSRCTLPEAMAAYAGAIRGGATVRMSLFHGENHELSRGGKPRNRVKRLEEITAWMDRYLKEARA